MQDFKLYFGLGTDHILNWEALDHILFVAALCLRYLIKDWKKVVVLVTAFTIGHSITLALSALGSSSLSHPLDRIPDPADHRRHRPQQPGPKDRRGGASFPLAPYLFFRLVFRSDPWPGLCQYFPEP